MEQGSDTEHRRGLSRNFHGQKALLQQGRVLACLLFLLSVFCHSKTVSGDELPVAVLISREIKPFIEMVEGFENSLKRSVVRIFLDREKNPFSHDLLYKGTDPSNYSVVVAVGPEALSYLVEKNFSGMAKSASSEKPSTAKPSSSTISSATLSSGTEEPDNPESVDAAYNSSKILYSMVLNPEKIIPDNVSLCGISLDPFTAKPLSEIPRILPFVKKIGILFDPENNSQWFDNAVAGQLFSNIEIIPMHIQKQSDIIELYQQGFYGVDALLFIPDQTVTSPTIIRHVIKQSIARKIPVIGYNSFFDKSGAALSFVIDYEGTGEQMAVMVEGVLRGESCMTSAPPYSIMLNEKVLELFGKKPVIHKD
ncbi:hypothetical protein MTBBW1_2200023 [Desulfamplus magnetovallimortis]|uniref:Uncharacterized protein n=1 Tax=Desulfamplus magnetovallimortis TaxID=1246637 RepID=A0A1W1HD20_9BACT|nr:ABC transporter substrate binding protein [Desulfamplus magnetovallimortis]SLM30369.1 hypothetical protein MTBBW1_2200023 [Desulfamplus magnetovallimortis]